MGRRRRSGAAARSALAVRLSAWLALLFWSSPGDALADIAPTPPFVYAPPTFLFLFIAVYLLLLTGVGLGALLRRVLRRSGGGASQRRVLATAAAVALVLTAVWVCVSEYASRRSRADRRARSAVKSNLGAIRSTEVAYFAEWNVWVGGQPLTPVADRSHNDEKVAWDSNTRFSILGFAPEGEVVCSYALEGPPWSAEGFTARAECDYDRDGQLAVYRITNTSAEIVKSGAPF